LGFVYFKYNVTEIEVCIRTRYNKKRNKDTDLTREVSEKILVQKKKALREMTERTGELYIKKT
jgi:hypothetical protein